MSMEQLKDSVVAIGFLQCDDVSRRYFRDAAKVRFDEAVPNLLDRQIRDISTWISFSQDARLIAQASRFRDTLRAIQQTIVSMRPAYA